MIEEERAEARMNRLRRLVRKEKYRMVVIPERTAVRRGDSDEHWTQGGVYGTWFLKPASDAAVWRQIQEARKLRREACESWIKVVGAVLPWVIALVSLLVSWTLAGRIARP